MKNAISPIMTIVGMQAGGMIGGTVLIEKIFNWPGLGNYALMSIKAFDLYVVAGIALIMSIVYVLISLIVDVLYVVSIILSLNFELSSRSIFFVL